jgi:hypothetical protein
MEKSLKDMSIDELKEQIQKYEAALDLETGKLNKGREKIEKMSAEVVDSNPYRSYSKITQIIQVFNY